MDPITHTFTGAALAAAGLRRTTPLATAALLMGANAPDIDALTYFSGGFTELAFRRGWTHGILALPLWPFVLTGLLLLWDRWVRRRRDPYAAPARAGPLLAVTALAVLTHPALDWLNNYGMRWLMPFDGTWFYGDALFIIDPWIWLALGGVLFLRYSNRRLSIARWTVFWTLASLVVLASTTLVPLPARVLWVVGLAALVAVRVRRFVATRRQAAADRAPTVEGAVDRTAATHGALAVDRALVIDRANDTLAAAALAIVAVYVGATVAASAAACAQVNAALAAAGIAGVEQVMVAPASANPFAGAVVAATGDTYYMGSWDWLAQPRFVLARESLERPRGEVFEAAARTRDAQQFLSWSRFPVVEIERATDDSANDGANDEGFVVRFSDARYRTTGGITGPTVHLGPDRSIRETPRADAGSR